jgi:hypothetical protein
MQSIPDLFTGYLVKKDTPAELTTVPQMCRIFSVLLRKTPDFHTYAAIKWPGLTLTKRNRLIRLYCMEIYYACAVQMVP